MSSDIRNPLQPISDNVKSTSTRTPPLKLAPIFLRTPTNPPYTTLSTPAQSSPELEEDVQTPPTTEIHFPSGLDEGYTASPYRKRVKLDVGVQGDLGDNFEDDIPLTRRNRSISDFFSPSTPSRSERYLGKEGIQKSKVEVEQPKASSSKVWRTGRKRLGLDGVSRSTCMIDTRIRRGC